MADVWPWVQIQCIFSHAITLHVLIRGDMIILQAMPLTLE